MAYRGRLLVELKSNLGEEIDKELEIMKGPELVRVQVVQKSPTPTPTRNMNLQQSYFLYVYKLFSMFILLDTPLYLTFLILILITFDFFLSVVEKTIAGNLSLHYNTNI